MSKFSEFSFRPHKHADGEIRMHGLVHVIDRSTGDMIGMLNPIADGGYIMRDRDGVRLSESFGSRFDDVCYTSRETAAANLRMRMTTIAQVTERRAASVSAGCPNKWHNTGTYRESEPCPECPTQPGLKFAVDAIQRLLDANPSSDVTAASVQVMLENLIYGDKS
jgi:hypothetical protein